MNLPDLQRLRRFALSSALVLFVFSISVVTPKPPLTAQLFGIELIIQRPAVVPLALVLISAYTLLRFAYYGLFLNRSPAATRRDAVYHEIKAITVHPQEQKSWGHKMFVPQKVRITYPTEERAQRAADQIRSVYRVWELKVKRESLADYADLEEEIREGAEPFWVIEYRTRRIWRIGRVIHDVDYWAPVWANAAALAAAYVYLA